ncbi:hypothetical protein D030_1824A, partial [Vibrio parahaemolyticus AQ3810]
MKLSSANQPKGSLPSRRINIA